MSETHEYDDIINLDHEISLYRKRMSLEDRAAQFAPFAALNGHSRVLARARNEHLQSFENEVDDEEKFGWD